MTEKTFVNKLQSLYNKKGYLTKKEIGVGYGVADLVLVRIDAKKAKIRTRNKQFKPLLNENYFKTFEFLPDIHDGIDPVKSNVLAEKINVSSSLLKYKILRDLKKNRYIKEVDKNLYFKVNGWLPLAKEVVAIEAKLKDWKRGFYQANRYKVFADKVYLAVPSNIIHVVDQKLLKKHNVGLISFDAVSRVKKNLIDPKIKEPLNINKRSFASEFFWSRQLANTLL